MIETWPLGCGFLVGAAGVISCVLCSGVVLVILAGLEVARG